MVNKRSFQDINIGLKQVNLDYLKHNMYRICENINSVCLFCGVDIRNIITQSNTDITALVYGTVTLFLNILYIRIYICYTYSYTVVLYLDTRRVSQGLIPYFVPLFRRTQGYEPETQHASHAARWATSTSVPEMNVTQC